MLESFLPKGIRNPQYPKQQKEKFEISNKASEVINEPLIHAYQKTQDEVLPKVQNCHYCENIRSEFKILFHVFC